MFAYFIGGPLDGDVKELPDDQLLYEVETHSELDVLQVDMAYYYRAELRLNHDDAYHWRELTANQVRVLFALPEEGFVRAFELARQLDVERRALRSTLLLLNGKGLLRRDLRGSGWGRLPDDRTTG